MRLTHGTERKRTICINLYLYSFIFLLLISKRIEEEHLCLVYESEDPNFDGGDSSGDDSSVEITSNIDQCEGGLIRLSTYLRLKSEDDVDHDSSSVCNDEPFEWPDPHSCLSSPGSLNSVEPAESDQSVLLSTTSADCVDIQGKSTKRKRSQRSVREKLDAIPLYDLNESKRSMATAKGCTTAQLRNWIKNREN